MVEHYEAAKRVMRYIQGTIDFGVWYKRGGKGEVKVFADSDYAGDYNDRKSTSGHLVLWDGAAVTWSSKKQSVVDLSSTEAEYVAAAACACQVIWCKHIGVRYHFLRDMVSDGIIRLEFCGTKEQLAEILTKPLHRDVFVKIRKQLGVCSLKGKQDMDDV
ncbi:secreted RxLR effector protein 161-like [Bidens hawaiensis]|uniref:secreted RxLR effector protein 161-like n=1 Tax=Bidens hawaiensis TaxID=980011 RepID=UPI00404B1721